MERWVQWKQMRKMQAHTFQRWGHEGGSSVMVICHLLIVRGHGRPSFVSIGYLWWSAVTVGCGVFTLWWQPMMDRVCSTKSDMLGGPSKVQHCLWVLSVSDIGYRMMETHRWCLQNSWARRMTRDTETWRGDDVGNQEGVDVDIPSWESHVQHPEIQHRPNISKLNPILTRCKFATLLLVPNFHQPPLRLPQVSNDPSTTLLRLLFSLRQSKPGSTLSHDYALLSSKSLHHHSLYPAHFNSCSRRASVGFQPLALTPSSSDSMMTMWQRDVTGSSTHTVLNAHILAHQWVFHVVQTVTTHVVAVHTNSGEWLPSPISFFTQETDDVATNSGWTMETRRRQMADK